jgi:hypothetical protein
VNDVIGYKLLRKRKDGTLGPLFINRAQRIPFGVWLKAKPHRTPGYAFRPGWHATVRPVAPHLSLKGRVWCRVRLRGVTEYIRPKAQGGTWLLAKQMKIEAEIKEKK